MKLGVVFPQTEIGDDPEHVARFARTAESARDKLESLAAIGVTHVSVSMMNLGLGGPEAHIDALADYWNAVQSLAS